MEERRPLIVRHMGPDLVQATEDLLTLLELAWHDCYGDITPSEAIIEDVLVVSGGTLAGLVGAARLAVTDWRDLWVAAERA
jgi:hypothetical protein